MTSAPCPDINALCQLAHAASKEKGFCETPRNRAELIALMHSELSEALEAIRKPAPDSHLPHLDPVGVELADCVIRIFDYCGEYGIDLERCILEKMAYNKNRPRKHGKGF